MPLVTRLLGNSVVLICLIGLEFPLVVLFLILVGVVMMFS